MANEKNKWTRRHGKWLFVLTIGFLWAVGVNVWNEHLRPKRENYQELWEWKAKQEVIQAEHEARIQKLEETP